MSHRLHPTRGTKRSERVPAIAALFFILFSLTCHGQQTVDVLVQSYRFQPQDVHIQTGDTVRWLNREKRTSHSIVFSGGKDNESERLFPDESWQRRFDTPGIYSYQCGPHPEMTGKVIVRTSSTSDACNTTDLNNDRAVRIGPDGASVEIVQGDNTVKRLTLRPNLLPEVHYLGTSRHAILATRDGWLLRLDLESGQQITERKLNAVVSSTALSAPHLGQNQLLAVGSKTPNTLTIVNEQFDVLKTIPVVDKTGRLKSGLATIRTAKTRDSFIILLADAPELWEVSYNPQAPEIGLGMVHDFQYREGHFVPGYLNPQRSTLPSQAQDFVLLNSGHEVLTVHGSEQALSGGGNVHLYVMHLDVRKTETKSPPRFLPDRPELSSLQVDHQTLPNNTLEPELQVVKSTLHFSESSRKLDKTTTKSTPANLSCVKQP